MKLPLLGNPSFTRYWLGDTASVLAYQMLVLAVAWQIYDITNSALSLGLVGLAHFLSQALFMLAAGHVADRYDRRRIVVICLVMQCGVLAALGIGSHGGWLTSEMIYACAFVTGIAQTFQSPALRALLPQLVAREVLPECIAWNVTVRKAAIITGPTLGGLLYLTGGSTVYATGAIVSAVAAAIIAGISAPAAARRHEPATLKSVFGGFAYIRNHRVLLGAISLDLFATFLGGATALLPIYAKDILETGPTGLGLLRAAPAVGAVFASAYLTYAPLTRGVGRTMYASVAVFGLATIVFGLSESLVLSFIALAIMGAGDMVSVVIRISLVQLETPDAMRGRVSAASALFTGTSNHLGQFESGVTAAWWGTVPAVVVGGIGTLLIVLLWMRWFPELAKREVLVGRSS
jgi:MFS family permease